jgi:hypothetical protein
MAYDNCFLDINITPNAYRCRFRVTFTLKNTPADGTGRVSFTAYATAAFCGTGQGNVRQFNVTTNPIAAGSTTFQTGYMFFDYSKDPNDRTDSTAHVTVTAPTIPAAVAGGPSSPAVHFSTSPNKC